MSPQDANVSVALRNLTAIESDMTRSDRIRFSTRNLDLICVNKSSGYQEERFQIRDDKSFSEVF